jgi:hypothetical protein
MFDLTGTADRIARWGDQLDLPKSLVAAIAVYREAQLVADPFDQPTAADINVKNVATTVAELAGQMAAKAQFTQARAWVLGVLARAVLAEARAALPVLMEQMEPVFDAAVERLVAASAMLPNHSGLTNDALVGAGVQAITAYGQAQEAAAVLNTIDQWLAGLVDLLGGDHDGHLLRCLDPADRAELKVISGQFAPAVAAAGGAWLAAAQSGIAFKMNTPAEASARKHEIESEPMPEGLAAIRRGAWA